MKHPLGRMGRMTELSLREKPICYFYNLPIGRNLQYTEIVDLPKFSNKSLRSAPRPYFGYILKFTIPENVVGVSEDLGGEPLGSVPPPF